MRLAVAALLLLVAGFAVGYTVRDRKRSETPARAERTDSDAARERRALLRSLTQEEKREIVERSFPELLRLEREAEEEALAEEEAARAAAANAAAADEALRERLRKTMRTQLPQWKTMFGINAKNAGEQMARKLDIPDALVDKVGAAFDKEGARAAEDAMSLMMAQYDGDPEDAFDGFMWFFGTAGTMSDELTTELGGFLSEDDIAGVREEMRLRHKQQLDVQAEMQLRMMNIPDLTDRQTTELKEMFSDGGMMREQGKVWSEIMKNPRPLIEAKTNEEWVQVLEPSMKSNRDRMRKILDDKQFEAYRRYETEAVSQFRMWVEPMIQGARKE